MSTSLGILYTCRRAPKVLTRLFGSHPSLDKSRLILASGSSFPRPGCGRRRRSRRSRRRGWRWCGSLRRSRSSSPSTFGGGSGDSLGSRKILESLLSSRCCWAGHRRRESSRCGSNYWGERGLTIWNTLICLHTSCRGQRSMANRDGPRSRIRRRRSPRRRRCRISFQGCGSVESRETRSHGPPGSWKHLRTRKTLSSRSRCRVCQRCRSRKCRRARQRPTRSLEPLGRRKVPWGRQQRRSLRSRTDRSSRGRRNECGSNRGTVIR